MYPPTSTLSILYAMDQKVSFHTESYFHQTVKELRKEEQPREKLQHHGAGSLTEAELLAIILRSGSGKLNVLQTSQAILKHFGSLRNLARRDWKELKVIPGIADVKALTLSAVFELARRIEIARLGDTIQIRNPEDAVSYFGPKLRDLTKETFVVAFLNAAKILSGYKHISTGGATATIVDPAEVMRQAIMNEANSIIILHNHPSGHTAPSQADLKLTRRIADSGKILGVTVEDHIIIADHDFLSLRAEGQI